MQYNEFMTAVCEIYGEYHSKVLKTITAGYITRWEETELDKVLSHLVTVKTAKYKTPPDPAELEEIFPRVESKETAARKAWGELNKNINASYDIIIGDVRAQYAVEYGFCGWVNFCGRTNRDENGNDIDQWNLKRFIEFYNSCPEYYTEVKKLSGDNGWNPKLIKILCNENTVAIEHKKNSDYNSIIQEISKGAKL